MTSLSLNKLKKRTVTTSNEKLRKKPDRFDGLSEEEVQKYTLPDYLTSNLEMVFVGINPSLTAAHRGRYYAGPGNHFYKLLYESKLTPRSVSFEEDYKLLQFGIGLTNIVERPTRSSAELKRIEMKEGSKIVEKKLRLYKPKIAIFNGKCIYEIFANKTNKSAFNFGLQPDSIGETKIWVVPSSSARCANFPRMVDKLHFYIALKKYLHFLNGEITEINVNEFCFEGKCKQFIPRTSKMWRRKNVSAFLHGGRIANTNTICLDTSEECVGTVHSTEFIVKAIECNETNESSPKVINEIKTELNPILVQKLCMGNNSKCVQEHKIMTEDKESDISNNDVLEIFDEEKHDAVIRSLMVAATKTPSPKPCMEENSKYVQEHETMIKENQSEIINNDVLELSDKEKHIASPTIAATKSPQKLSLYRLKRCSTAPDFVNLIRQRLTNKLDENKVKQLKKCSKKKKIVSSSQ